MIKLTKLAFWSLFAVLLMAVPAFAQEGPRFSIEFTRSFGVAIAIVGGAWGIGKLASTALEGMARQPEVAGNIQTAMIIAAALIEGATLFALVILGFVLQSS